jgi:lambda family phage portal protein
MREVLPAPLSWEARWSARLDRVVNLLSPRWGLRRLAARSAIKALSSYRGAEKSRLRGDWRPLGGSADADLLADLPTLRERARDLNRNDAHASAITNTVVVNTVGTGLKPQCRLDRTALDLTEEPAREFEKAAESAFDRWCRFADGQNRIDFYEMQSLVQRQILDNGEVLVLPLMIPDEPGRPLRLALEVIEADRLETPVDRRSDPTIRDGVELGARGQPVAYWIRTRHPGDILLGQATGLITTPADYRRYPAVNNAGRRNVFHLYWQKRPGQTRGEPFFAPVLSHFKDLADYLEAEIVAKRVQACFAAFVTKTDPYGSAVASADSTNTKAQRVQEFEPGMIEYLSPGESITFGQPTPIGDTFEPFVHLVLRAIGASLGLPLELVLKDFSKTNYSSARAALLEARRFFRGYQQWLATRFCQPVWEMVQEEAWLQELLPPVNLFSPQRDEWMKTRWIAPGWGWVDPVKEVESSVLAIQSGLSTLADECAGQGRDGEEVMNQLAAERKEYADLGLTYPPDTVNKSKAGAPAQDQTTTQDQSTANQYAAAANG